MIHNRKNGRASVLTQIILGWLVAYIVTLIMAIIGAIFVSAERIGQESEGILATVTILASIVAGALVALKNQNERRIVICLISAAVYFVSLLCTNLLFFSGQFQSIGVSALLIFGAAIAVSLLGFKRNTRKRSPVKLPRLR